MLNAVGLTSYEVKTDDLNEENIDIGLSHR